MSYERIQALPADRTSLGSSDLSALGTVWQQRRADLEADGRLAPFLRRLCREWAIETGIIERLYTWDQAVTEVLIEQGLEASIIAHRTHLDAAQARQVADLITDHLEIVEGLFDNVKGARPLSEHFIRTLHQAFTRNQHTTTAVDALG